MHRLSSGVLAVLLFSFVGCLVWALLSTVARGLAPGIWGYVAAAAALASFAPIPALFISRGLGHFLSRFGVLMLASVAAFFVAILAGVDHWPAWAALLVVVTAAALVRLLTGLVQDIYVHDRSSIERPE